MARSRRSYRKSKPKVRVGVASKNVFKPKPATSLPPKAVLTSAEWDENASLLRNYKALGIVNNPNFLGARSSNKDTVVSSLQLPNASEDLVSEEGSDIESDDLKETLGKKRRDGQHAPLQRLTKMQRVYVNRLIMKHKNDYMAMSKDMKLNKMQHTPAALEKLCKRFLAYEKPLAS
ncbi:hypothetical protein KP509_21G024100 [Ceratopteris richardii]|uniref:Nucleolar protein 16 n=1 Tax=Ceratopteris richardii TaxID=49495 RepID=A0A8T2S849_CERRI|nr:hypothetical protein KP509_21G024100 [Ceratopteris richardii]